MTSRKEIDPSEIHKKGVRDALEPRREPYWRMIRRGEYIGYRKLDSGSQTWIARRRGEDGKQTYTSLGVVTDAKDGGFDDARAKAEAWFKLKDTGITDEIVTVEHACRRYVEERRKSKSEECARDAEARFERVVYDDPIGKRALSKLRTAHIKSWRDGLELSPAAKNRTLVALKAALNLAVRERNVVGSQMQEWRDVKPLPNANKRRDLFLDLGQRRALLAACNGAVRDLVEAVTLTGARAGELVNARRRQFDARTGTMTFTGKTGTRTVPLTPAAVTLFTRLAESKLPNAWLLTRDDGKPWAHSDWDELVREAAQAAELPKGTCLYTLRHSFITAALTEGMTTLDVARLVGTSVMMIEKHYGHLVASAARERLAKVNLL
jgi:integrase